MMSHMKRPLRAMMLAVTLLLAAPAASRAEDAPVDARMMGYEREVALKEGTSSGLTWFLLSFLSVIAVVVVFKSGNRTHLD